MGQFDISWAGEEGSKFVRCEVVCQFFGSVGIIISSVDVGFVGRMVWVCDKIVEKLLNLVLVREDLDTSQVDSIFIKGGSEWPGDRLM